VAGGSCSKGTGAGRGTALAGTRRWGRGRVSVRLGRARLAPPAAPAGKVLGLLAGRARGGHGLITTVTFPPLPGRKEQKLTGQRWGRMVAPWTPLRRRGARTGPQRPAERPVSGCPTPCDAADAASHPGNARSRAAGCQDRVSEGPHFRREPLDVSLSICCSSPPETNWARSALHPIQEIHMFWADFFF